MITLLKNWEGKVEFNKKLYDNLSCVDLSSLQEGQPFSIVLYSKNKKSVNTAGKSAESVDNKRERRISVKQYMTRKSTPEFDFMAKFNNDNPMPLRTMIGTVEKETKGMVYMNLHGFGEPVIRCMRCGKLLTNEVSKRYGIGPECITKLGFECDIEDVDTITTKMQEVKWSGWIIKSAITEQEEVEND